MTSHCDECLTLVPAKILVEDDRVFYLKRCRKHGVRKVLVSTDAATGVYATTTGSRVTGHS